MDIHSSNNHLLNVAATCLGTRSLGPGWRSVVWVQGCMLRCPGCIAPEWIPQIQARLVHPKDLARELLSDPKIKGITISGGEPMLQAAPLTELVLELKAIRDVTIISYSGYRYEWLINQPESSGIPTYLRHIDLLIDGPFLQSENNNLGLRGSRNQRFIHLTDRLTSYEFANTPRKIEVQIVDGQLLMIGIPPNRINIAIDSSIDHLQNLRMKRGKYVWS